MPRDREEYNSYMRDYMRDRYAKNTEIVRNLKVERGCFDCGYNAHHAGLEFDHREPGRGKKETVASLMGRSIERIMQEIDKCDVVCRTCHGIRTFNRQQEKLNKER